MDTTQDHSKDVMIALLPSSSEWCQTDLPHLTLVSCGTIGDHSPTDFNKMAKDAASLAQLSSSLELQVSAVSQMGSPDGLVDALMFRANTKLQAMRNFVEQWNMSAYDFKPHATIGPFPTFMRQPALFDPPSVQDVPSYSSQRSCAPSYVRFDRIAVCWGNDEIVFNLGSGY